MSNPNAPAGHPAYLFLLNQWGGRPPMAVNVRPMPEGVFVSAAASSITWFGGPPQAAND